MRIQILPLPAVMVGDDLEEPFALVYDQAEEGVHKALLGEFARQCGAKTYVVVPQTVEIVDRYVGPESASVADGTTDAVIKDAFPEKVADDMPWLTAGWPRLQRQPVDSEHYEALRRDVAEMLDSLRQLAARPKLDLSMQISLPEDFDAEKVQRDLRFALGLCQKCGEKRCVCLPSEGDEQGRG